MIAPLCLLREGAFFFFPVEGKDLLFRIVDKTETEVTAKEIDGPQKLYLSPETMVLTENEERALLKYATFDSLLTYTPFFWGRYPYIKITDKEAIRLTPVVDKRESLSTLVRNLKDTRRLPTEDEVLNLTFLPSLPESLYQKNIDSTLNLDPAGPVTLYIVERFTEKTVVRLEKIFTK